MYGLRNREIHRKDYHVDRMEITENMDNVGSDPPARQRHICLL